MALRLILVLFISSLLFAEEGKIFQVAPFNNLEEGGFGGYYEIGDLEKQGDFGLGALQGLAGELIIYKGDYLYADQKGKIRWAKKRNKTPFAQVCHFKSEYSFHVKNIRNFKSFSRVLIYFYTKYFSLTLSLLIGFMMGSIANLWPFWKVTYHISLLKDQYRLNLQRIAPEMPALTSYQTGLALTMVILGIGAVIVMERKLAFKKLQFN